MSHATFPPRIFLATDFSGHCDRALARAAQLAQTWNSALLVAHSAAVLAVVLATMLRCIAHIGAVTVHWFGACSLTVESCECLRSTAVRWRWVERSGPPLLRCCVPAA